MKQFSPYLSDRIQAAIEKANNSKEATREIMYILEKHLEPYASWERGNNCRRQFHLE